MKRRLLLTAAMSSAAWTAARADAYPSRAVSILVGYAAGGAVDTVARVIADRLRVDLNQQVVIENRPGASGLTAAAVLGRAAPDGYTLGVMTNGTLTMNAQMVRPVPFNAAADFTPVGLLAINDGVIVVNPGFPATDLAGFVRTVKEAPGRYFFASSGTGGSTHLGGELVMETAGLRMTHVPYQGDSPALVDVMSGRVPVMFTVMPSVADHIRSGRVRAIAALGDRRFPGFPDLPTAAETYPGLNASAWLALFGPRGMSPDVVATVNAALRTTLSDAGTVARLANVGSVARSGSPEELRALVAGDLAKWKPIIDRLGLAPA